MLSSELVVVNPYEDILAEGARHTDLTIIYNTHGKPEDALQTAGFIPPNSLVFTEGYLDSMSADRTKTWSSYVNNLSNIRLTQGPGSAQYSNYKAALMRALAAAGADYTPQDAFDFTAYELALLTELLGKDCFIANADYTYQPLGDEADVYTKEKHEQNDKMFRTASAYVTLPALRDIDPTDGLGSHLQYLLKSVQGQATYHLGREIVATVELLTTARWLRQTARQEPFYNAEADRIQAYLIFGAAHCQLLTSQFTRRGVQPSIINLDPSHPSRMLDIVDEPGYNNGRRRIGHSALRTLSHTFLEYSSARSLSEDAYDNLEFLNEADHESFKSFIVTCANIARESNRDTENAFHWYLSLLRSFMPNPLDYVQLPD